MVNGYYQPYCIALLVAGRTSIFSLFSMFAQSSSVKLLNLEAAVVNNSSKFSENTDPDLMQQGLLYLTT